MDHFSPLTLAEIVEECRVQGIVIPRRCRSRVDIVGYIGNLVSSQFPDHLRHLADAKFEERQHSFPQPSDFWEDWHNDSEHFMDPPISATVHHSYTKYYEATSQSVVGLAVCGVCAGEFSGYERAMSTFLVEDLPNRLRLAPASIHRAQELTGGLLLQREALSVRDGRLHVVVCDACLSDLRKSSPLPPSHSLANKLWIGPIPDVLQHLTISEQMLISLIFPRIYVYKLYPKMSAGRSDQDSFQRGMRGTLSSYAMDQKGIGDMVSGNFLPHMLAVLPSVLSVTIVGQGSLPRNWMKRTFAVRRRCVYDALVWLKANNVKYYGEIVIDGSRLSALPIDDVPGEIVAVVRQTSEVEVLDEEHDGYVPIHDDDVECDDPSVVPLELSGGIDADLTEISAQEIMTYGMANLWNQGREGGYVVRHSGRPVNDFGDGSETSYFEKAFPTLFPWGCGGPECSRPVALSLHDHAKWCMRYVDRRFRKHETFPFICFALQQRRQALGSARIQMQRQSFERDARMLSSITVDAMRQASEEEARKQPISDLAVRLLRKQVNAAAGRVQGTDAGRARVRSEIWSTMMMLGPPNLWITVNPNDINDPIAQVFAGENINMDLFDASLGPSKERRASNIAADPYAGAKFFHFTMKTIFEVLFGIRRVQYSTHCEDGILGRVSAYIGTVESQGRGTLHCHLLVWLQNNQSPTKLAELLQSDAFRVKMAEYLQVVLCAYLPGFENLDSLKAIPVEPELAFSRPFYPMMQENGEEIIDIERRLARAQQVHSCRAGVCLFSDKEGHYYCKRNAPFPCSDHNFVDSCGRWAVERRCGNINIWVRGILLMVRCNCDGKLLTNARETRNVTFYVTFYATKKQQRSHNLSAVMADGFAYHDKNIPEDYITNVREQHRLMLFRLVNSINRVQELSGPMVMSYLMDWGDIFRSHTYSPIYWSSFVGALFQCFPMLQRSVANQSRSSNDVQVPFGDGNSQEDVLQSSDDNFGVVTLEFDPEIGIWAKSQVTDYRLRGNSLELFNVLQFFVDTYDTSIRGKTNESSRSQLGRPRHNRSDYDSRHPKAQQLHRVVRSVNHCNLPNIIGSWFPRNDDPTCREFYCASMLMLLKPWRDLKTDLKEEEQTWEEAWTIFSEIASNHTAFVVDCIQHYHDCESHANTTDALPVTQEHDVHDTMDVDLDNAEEDINYKEQYTEDGLQVIKKASMSVSEGIYGRLAVEHARFAHMFSRDSGDWDIEEEQRFRVSTAADRTELERWRELMKRDVIQINQNSVSELSSETVERLDLNTQEDQSITMMPLAEEPLDAISVDELRADQHRAYEIVLSHLDRTLAGESLQPLHMILYGEGGTGKSKVIQSISTAFRARGVEQMLAKSAYTGVAASLIEGKTTHTIGSINVRSSHNISDETRAKLQAFWREKQYLIIDEFSMISKSFLAILSRHIGIGKVKDYGSDSQEPFGGINVILCGDLHQFPPVGRSKRDTLFYSVEPVKDSFDQKIGRTIYEQFQTVIILTEQMRVVDPVWHSFLQRLRNGCVARDDILMLRSLLLGSNKDVDDFSSEPWCSASLVTPRHAVRMQWNDAMAREHCRRTRTQLLVCGAEDSIKGRALTMEEKYAVAMRHQKDGQYQRKQLADDVYLARGMKVMVTTNVETDLDVTNGARGVIEDILLHEQEQIDQTKPVVHLQSLPSVIFVRLERTRASQLPGLDNAVIPIEPFSTRIQIKLNRCGGKTLTRTVKRCQFPITPAYAFTDYRAQGQTIPYAIIDIARPPTGGLSLFNLYVAFSRSRSRESARLLRDFDDELFFQFHDAALLAEDDRLSFLHEQTRSKNE